MVAGSRCNGRASTKATITAMSTASDCLSSVQSRMVSFTLIPMTRARRAGVDLSALPHKRWIISACAAMTTMITGVRWMTKAFKSSRPSEPIRVSRGERADQDVGRIPDQRRGAADIGGEHLGEQERIRRNIELPGDGERHRHDQEDRRHVVEQCGNHGGGELQQQQNSGGTGLRP